MIHTSALTKVNQALNVWSFWHYNSFLYAIYLFPQYWSLWISYIIFAFCVCLWVCVWFSLSAISPSMIFRPSVTFSVRLSVCQLQRQAVVCQQSHHLWFSVCLSVCQLQRYQEMTEFYDVNFLAPPILNAPNKIFGPKLAHSSSCK